ncbi:hypothetical protein ACJJTC_018300 [Scirpophaga incertulas]
MTDSPTTDTDFNTYGKFECRCCLQNVGAIGLLCIYDPWSQPFDGMADTIVEDLVKIANIEITDTDGFTKYICNECYGKLQFACSFVACVRENDRYLRSKCSDTENSSVVGKVWPKPIQLDTHIAYQKSSDVEIKQEVFSDVENDCNLNGEAIEKQMDVKVEPEDWLQPTAQINGFINHERLDTNCQALHVPHNGNVDYCNDEQVKEEPVSDTEEMESMLADLPLQCLLCTKDFKSVSGLKAHVISQHSYKTVKRKSGDSPEKPQKTIYTCETCKRVFTTSTDLMVHETCHDKWFCYSCNSSCESFESLVTHRKICNSKITETTPLKTLDDVKRRYNNGL